MFTVVLYQKDQWKRKLHFSLKDQNFEYYVVKHWLNMEIDIVLLLTTRKCTF